MSIKEWLEQVKKALLDEGFQPTEFQWVKPGQYFGLVKDLPRGRQMHVRGFSDGKLEAEIEVSRFYLEHPLWKRSATKELEQILRRRGVPYKRETILQIPKPKGKMPKTRTDWRRSLIHPSLYKFLSLYVILLGAACFYKFALALSWSGLLYFLAGGALVGTGVGTLYTIRVVERALKSH